MAQEKPPKEPTPEEIEVRRLRDLYHDKLEALARKHRAFRGPIAEEELTPEQIDAGITQLQIDINEKCAGENFESLAPELQQCFFDIEDAIYYTPDRKRLLEAMRLFLELISEI